MCVIYSQHPTSNSSLISVGQNAIKSNLLHSQNIHLRRRRSISERMHIGDFSVKRLHRTFIPPLFLLHCKEAACYTLDCRHKMLRFTCTEDQNASLVRRNAPMMFMALNQWGEGPLSSMIQCIFSGRTGQRSTWALEERLYKIIAKVTD